MLPRLLRFALLSLLGSVPANAHTWEVTSPDRGQTFAYGSEHHRSWIARGSHLSIVMEFTNDPYVDRINIRQYDDFEFNFPQIRRAQDGRTFFFHPRGHGPVAVARRSTGWFGAQVRLLDSSELLVEKAHGSLRLTLVVSDSPTERD